MPIYEYICDNEHKHERHRPMSECKEGSICPQCGQVAKRIMSTMFWHLGFKFLKDKSRNSPPAPTDSGYHPEWDQAYAP